MKKNLVGALLLSFFSVGAIGGFTPNFGPDKCYKYAVDAAGLELLHYGGTWGEEEYLDAALDYYDMCIKAGGNISNPVFG